MHTISNSIYTAEAKVKNHYGNFCHAICQCTSLKVFMLNKKHDYNNYYHHTTAIDAAAALPQCTYDLLV